MRSTSYEIACDTSYCLDDVTESWQQTVLRRTLVHDRVVPRISLRLVAGQQAYSLLAGRG